MLSAVITALLLVVMLLIVASFVFGAWRGHKRHLQTLTAQTPEWSLTPPDRRVTAADQVILIGIERDGCGRIAPEGQLGDVIQRKLLNLVRFGTVEVSEYRACHCPLCALRALSTG